MNRIRKIVLIALLLATGASLLGAGSAGAATYVNTPGYQYDMRGFVATGTPLFGCWTGAIGLGSIRLQAPSNLGTVRALITFSAWTTNSSGQWVRYTYPNGENAKSPNPYPGIVMTPGQVKSTTPSSWAVPRGYYYLEVEVDWHYDNSSSQLSFSKVTIKPTTTADYSATYRYQGNGYSYCYA
jgi:hypothetical protein